MTRGPVPKRADQRRRRNATEPVTSAEGMPVTVPEAPAHWHPLALQMFDALKASGQSVFYQQSDWAFAVITCERLSVLLADEVTQGAAWADVNAALARLMVTEGDRRRLRLEVSTPDASPKPERSAPVRRLKAVDRVAE